jgi:hypothetical protein
MGFAGYVSACVQLACVCVCLLAFSLLFVCLFCQKETTKIMKENSTEKTQMEMCRV